MATLEEKNPLSTELVTLEQLKAVEVFTDNGLEPFLVKVEERVRAVSRDISTEAGRKAINKFAREIASVKTKVDAMGKALTEGWKTQAKAVDKEKGRAWDRLQALQDEFRKPLTDWEKAEADRVKAHEDALVEIEGLTTFPFGVTLTPEALEKRIERLHEVGKSRSWEEFAARATEAHDRQYKALTEKLAEVKKAIDDAAELQLLKEEKAKKDREKELEDARLAGIEEGKKAAAAASAEPAPAATVAVGRIDPVHAVTPAQKMAAVMSTAAPLAAAVSDPAVEAKRKVNASIVKAFVDHGVVDSAETAQNVVKAILAGKIPNVTINY